LGIGKIDVNIVNTIAPYVISHRAVYVKRELDKSPYFGNKYQFSENLLNSIQKRFKNRQTCYEIAERFREGNSKENDLEELKKFEKNDLIVKFDLIPFVSSVNNKKYPPLAQQIKNAAKKGDLEKLADIRNELLEEIDFPNRGDLIEWCNLELYKQTVTDYIIKFSYWKDVWADIEINVTGTNEDSLVNIQISGGSEALKLRSLMDNLNYIKKQE